jgi:WD40 repeat protein
VRLLDAPTGKQVLEIKARTSGPAFPMGVVHWIAFHPEGTRIVSGRTDEQVKVWSSERRKP